MAEHIGVIEEAGFKPKKPPKTGQNFCMKVAGWDRTYYINKEEDKPLQVLAIQLMGKTAKITYEQSGEYRNISTIEEVAPLPTTEPTDDHMSKGDWAEKDKRIARIAIAKSLIENPGESNELFQLMQKANLWFNWVYEIHQTVKPAEPVKASVTNAMIRGQTGATPSEPTPKNRWITAIWVQAGKQGMDQDSLYKELDDFAKVKKWASNAISQDHLDALSPTQLDSFFEYIKALKIK